jgi:hypothetical protein
MLHIYSLSVAEKTVTIRTLSWLILYVILYSYKIQPNFDAIEKRSAFLFIFLPFRGWVFQGYAALLPESIY